VTAAKSGQWLDKDGNLRILAITLADGNASVTWIDKDEKARIHASTLANGDVLLPTEDLTSPKKP